MPADTGDTGAPQGLSWSWALDFDALITSLTDAGFDATALSRPSRGDIASAFSRSRGGPTETGTGGGCPADPGITPLAGDLAGPGERDDAGDLGNDDPSDHGAGDYDGSGDYDDVDHHGGPRIAASALAGMVAERLAPGPDLVAWLALAEAPGLDDASLAAVAGSWRRVVSWAQAQELAAVAQMASRAAARDEDIGVDADGRPARIPAAAAAEVALELTMSQYAAAWWSDLAVQLCWRLAATGTALAAGTIDLQRARLIAEATGRLSDEAARRVEERVLPAAGEQTTGMLRATLRRAVIAADPAGAERRREEAERQARVTLFADEETTATLAGQRLPGVHAAAAMARIKAMARAWKSSGASGGIDLLCAKIYLGLLLGTLPLIPPAEGAPPDDLPPDDLGGEAPGDCPRAGPPGDGPGGQPPGDHPPGNDRDEQPPGNRCGPERPGGNPGVQGPAGGRARDNPGSGPTHDPGQSRARDNPASGPPRSRRAVNGARPAGDGARPAGDGARPAGDGARPAGDGARPAGDGTRSAVNGARGSPPPGGSRDSGPRASASRGSRPGARSDDAPRDRSPGDYAPRADNSAGDRPGGQVPPPGGQDAPRGEEDYPCPGSCPAGYHGDRPGDDSDDDWARDDDGWADDDDGWADDRRAPEWPRLPAVIPPAFARPRDGRPAAGLLDVCVPWEVLAGIAPGPGYLGRIGPVTGPQARCLADCAARDPAAEWRIIVTDRDGHALGVTRVRRPRDRAGAVSPGDSAGGAGNSRWPGAGIGLVARVTLTIPEDLLAGLLRHRDCADDLGLPSAGWIVGQALGAAASAEARARATAAASAAAGGCAHDAASPGYRPPARLREHVIARDLTCRFPRCRQPAWRGDLDHTIPFDDGGLTCRCNLGGLCRAHHNLKQHPAWKLVQSAPGTFSWTTPAGRTFTATPDPHPV